MTELHESLLRINLSEGIPKDEIVKDVEIAILAADYEIVEQDSARPWGAFFRLSNNEGDKFVDEFFPGLDPQSARLGNPTAELSPKILLVSPGQRLSWQYHDRRAERWAFINDGAYYRSHNDTEGEVIKAAAGDIVQFDQGERHRLLANLGRYTMVAEIWQHMDPDYPSTEDDIIRIQDDYRR